MWARHRHSFLTMPNSYETNTSAAVISQQHAWEITLQSAKSLQKHTFATSFPQRAGPQRICVIVHFSSVVKSIFYSSPLYPGQFLILCWSPRSNSLFFSLKWNMRASRLPQAAGVLFFFSFARAVDVPVHCRWPLEIPSNPNGAIIPPSCDGFCCPGFAAALVNSRWMKSDKLPAMVRWHCQKASRGLMANFPSTVICKCPKLLL